MISLSSMTYFSCNSFRFASKYSWSAKRLDIVQTIDLASNPTLQSSDLVLQPNTLDYGSYMFTLNLNIDIMNSDGSVITQTLSSSLKATRKICPTGIVVNAVKNGISSVMIGSQQNFSLNPALYSADLDNLVAPSVLKFKFYCLTLLKNSTNPSQQNIDLYTYKNVPQLLMSRNGTCFDSNSKLKKIKNKGKALKHKYVFYILF